LSNPFFPQKFAIAIAIAVHPDNQQRCMWPALSPPQQPVAATAAAANLNNPPNV
jgi:hypothetical protein